MNTGHGAFLFAVCNDELLQQRVNEQIQFLLQGKHKTIRVFSFRKGDGNTHPLTQLQLFLSQNPETAGLIIADLDYALNERQNPGILIQLNFSREALLEFNIPVLFWVTTDSLPQLSRQAIDLYSQRITANLYFERPEELIDGDNKTAQYIIGETAKANTNIVHLEARVKLLHEQLNEALTQNLDRKKIANEIVIPLLDCYVKIPGTEAEMVRLLNTYNLEWNKGDAGVCFALGRIYQTINDYDKAEQFYELALKLLRDAPERSQNNVLPGIAVTLNNLANLWANQNEFKKAEQAYNEALEIYKDSAKINPKTLPDVAMTLNNLANLWAIQNEFTKAEQAFQEALEIRRNLAKTNPQTFLPDVAVTLNNLANLWMEKNEFARAEQGYQEALDVYKNLAKTNPQTFLGDVAMTLNNLANLLSVKKEFTKAEQTYLEALVIRRNLAKTNPQTFSLDAAGTTCNLALLFTYGAPDKAKALSFAKETLVSALPFSDFLPLAKEIITKALTVAKHWDEDPDKFLEEAKQTLANQNNPATPTDKAKH
jgi:tetratricopeptide (TPR) repeat protein